MKRYSFLIICIVGLSANGWAQKVYLDTAYGISFTSPQSWITREFKPFDIKTDPNTQKRVDRNGIINLCLYFNCWTPEI